MHVAVSAVVDAPVEKSWKALSAFGDLAAWAGHVKASDLENGKKLQEGVVRVVERADGTTERQRVVEVEDHGFRYEIVDGIDGFQPVFHAWNTSEAADRSVITLVASALPKSAGARLTAPLVKRRIRKDLQALLEDLTAHIEGRGPPQRGGGKADPAKAQAKADKEKAKAEKQKAKAEATAEKKAKKAGKGEKATAGATADPAQKQQMETTGGQETADASKAEKEAAKQQKEADKRAAREQKEAAKKQKEADKQAAKQQKEADKEAGRRKKEAAKQKDIPAGENGSSKGKAEAGETNGAVKMEPKDVETEAKKAN